MSSVVEHAANDQEVMDLNPAWCKALIFFYFLSTVSLNRSYSIPMWQILSKWDIKQFNEWTAISQVNLTLWTLVTLEDESLLVIL